MTTVRLASGLGALFHCTRCHHAQAIIAATDLPQPYYPAGDVLAWCPDCADACAAVSADPGLDEPAREAARLIRSQIRALLPQRGEPA